MDILFICSMENGATASKCFSANLMASFSCIKSWMLYREDTDGLEINPKSNPSHGSNSTG